MASPAQTAAERIKSLAQRAPVTAIILGRNFHGLADLAANPVAIPYSELPGFPATPGGEALICQIEDAPSLILKGASSFYETGDAQRMSGAIEALTHLRVRTIICPGFVTSLRPETLPGAVVAVTDHINFSGANPLIGIPEAIGVNLNDCYDRRLVRAVKQAATGAGFNPQDGVLMWCSGPTFETPAEAKAARLLGADMIGWSIAPEAIIARRFGVPFLGLALVTDLAPSVPGAGAPPSADIARGPVIAGLVSMRRLLRGFMKQKL